MSKEWSKKKKESKDHIDQFLEKNPSKDSIDKKRPLHEITKVYPVKGNRKGITKDVIISAYVAEGLSIKELSHRYKLSENTIESIVKENKLPELRKAYIVNGIEKIQNKQLKQANELLDLESRFAELRILQLKEQYEQYAAYFARFGDLKKRNPQSGDILTNNDGIALSLKIPNISHEIRSLKESVNVSEGMRKILGKLEFLLDEGDPVGGTEEPDIIDVTEFDYLFDSE